MIHTTDYSDNNKPVKRMLEIENFSYIKEKGGFFGVAGPALQEHWEVYNNILRPDSPFVVAEHDYQVYQVMRPVAKTITDKRFSLFYKDVFSMIKTLCYNDIHGTYRYGHLDLCKQIHTLVNKENLIDDLIWLAQWEGLKSVFYLDFTISARQEGSIYTDFMDNILPWIFRVNGWEVHNPKGFSSFTKCYRDYQQTPMANALYKFVKRKKRINKR